MSSLITIVIPVYNREVTLLRTLRSIESQSVAPAEVILVDNGSTDGSPELMRQWMAGRPNVRLLHEKKRGACAARNRGLEEVRTEFVEFFDSDDEMLPHHIADFENAIKANPDFDIYGRNIVTKRLDGSCRTEYFTARNAMFHHIFRSSLSTGRIVVRTALMKTVGGWNEELTGWDDYELGIRLLLNGGKAKKISGRPSVIAYQQEDSLTGINFSSHPERWERAMDTVRGNIIKSGRNDLLKWVDARCMILAAQYKLESLGVCSNNSGGRNAMLAEDLKNKVLERTPYKRGMKLIYLHNRYFRRLTWMFARMLFPW